MLDIVRQEVINAARRIVVKIGTNVLTAADGSLDLDHLAHLADQIVDLRKSGREAIVVSSGAIGAGLARMQKTKRPTNLPELQAAAAIGQANLIRAYDNAFKPHGFAAAQLLLTASDFDDRTRYLNARNTILQIVRWNAIPIINENDTISTAEIRFGDNDQLAAMVTNLVRAPLLIILSVVDGLFAGDPVQRPDLEPIDMVMNIDEEILGMVGPSTSGLGTGGMKSKLASAQLATAAGESVWIANGKSPDILRRILRGEKLGTLMPARGESVASWKRWIGYTARPRGAYAVDDGARTALVDKQRSLLPVGVTAVRGEFVSGDVVAIEDAMGRTFARGLTNYSAEEARRIMGKSANERSQIGASFDEIVHRDNLVIL